MWRASSATIFCKKEKRKEDLDTHPIYSTEHSSNIVATLLQHYSNVAIELLQ